MDLKRYLEDVGETQAEFAKRSGISQSQVSRLVRGLHDATATTADRALEAIKRKPPRGKPPTLKDFRRKIAAAGRNEPE